MSYASRLYRQRNPRVQEGKKQKPFFSHQQDINNSDNGNTFFQTKLSVNEPGDSYEKEADSVANAVVNKSPAVQPIQQNKISSVQRLATAPEEEKVGTNDERMERDKEKPFQLQKKGMDMGEDKSKEEDKKGTSMPIQTKSEGNTMTASGQLSSKIKSSAGRGNKLAPKTLNEMNSSFGANFNNVHIHHDSEAGDMNNELNAQAFTHGKDIYFNQGKFNPENAEGKRLLAHELTHVVQQQDEIKRDMIQRNLARSMPTTNGVFGIDMQTQTFPNKTGLAGSIDFMPDQNAPYSNEISMIQIARPTDPATGKVLSAVSNSGVPGENALVTQDNPLTGVEGGFASDVLHNRRGAHQGSALSPNFAFSSLNQGAGGACTGKDPQAPGFKRSNDAKDIRQAKISDCPGVGDHTSNVDFKFETVVKGTDSNAIYGSLHWGFKARAGTVIDENASAKSDASATFTDALKRHQDFYTHVPVIFYFDFNHDDLNAAEQAKLNKEVIDYLKRFPDVKINISGFSDNVGDPAFNRDLAARRSEAVAQLFIRSGAITADKINPFKIIGSTTQFTKDAITSQDNEANRRGNRRVTVEFEHNATVPLPGQNL